MSIDDCLPHTVRAVILARISEPGARDSDVEGQVEQCKAFNDQMGWNLVRDAYTFAEKKSGFRNVQRPMLDAVLALCQRREIDVIICREFERVARTKLRRYQAVQTALDYGVEFRFANLKPNGKLPNTREGKAYLERLEEFGEMERERILERLTPGLERRWAKGIPGQGRSGPNYGYRWRPKAQGETSYTAYEEDPDESAILREMFRRLDEEEEISMCKLAADLEARGVRTPSGLGRWSVPVISRMIRNPIYCGRGRRLRWRTFYTDMQDDITARVYAERGVDDRMRDPDKWESETIPLAEGAVPILIEPELWDRVLQKIAVRTPWNGRVGRPGSRHRAEDTLLHGDIVRCAHCGVGMKRWWSSREPSLPSYRCDVRGSNPAHPCARHSIAARKVDALVLELLQKALTQPEQVLALADAAEARYERATTETALADSALDAFQRRLDEIPAERAKYVRVISVLDPQTDADDIARYRARVRQLDEDQAEAEKELEAARPRRDRAIRRQELLQALTNYRFHIDWDTDTIVKESEPRLAKWIDADVASELLGDPPLGEQFNEYLRTHGKPTLDPEMAESEAHMLLEQNGMWNRPREEVIGLLLKYAPPERVRKLLRDLDAKVLISRPRPPEERALHGLTPVEERVTLSILGLNLRSVPGVRIRAY